MLGKILLIGLMIIILINLYLLTLTLYYYITETLIPKWHRNYEIKVKAMDIMHYKEMNEDYTFTKKDFKETIKKLKKQAKTKKLEAEKALEGSLDNE